MMNANLEHVNVTVRDVVATAAKLIAIFDWKIRWKGPSMDNGTTIHVGTDTNYIALYQVPTTSEQTHNTYHTPGGLNHIGVVVDDLEEAERRVVSQGYKPGEHYDYEPGRRFYFDQDDGIEIEVISYE